MSRMVSFLKPENSESDIDQILLILKSHPSFINKNDTIEFIKQSKVVKVALNQYIESREFCYLICSGSLAIYTSQYDPICSLNIGGIFPHFNIHINRIAIAQQDSILLQMPRDLYIANFVNQDNKIKQEIVEMLAKTEPFKTFKENILRNITNQSEIFEFQFKNILLEVNKEPSFIYIILQGEFKLYYKQNSDWVEIATVSEQQLIGEYSIIQKKPSLFKVVCISNNSQVVGIPKQYFLNQIYHNPYYCTLMKVLFDRLINLKMKRWKHTIAEKLNAKPSGTPKQFKFHMNESKYKIDLTGTDNIESLENKKYSVLTYKNSQIFQTIRTKSNFFELTVDQPLVTKPVIYKRVCSQRMNYLTNDGFANKSLLKRIKLRSGNNLITKQYESAMSDRVDQSVLMKQTFVSLDEKEQKSTANTTYNPMKVGHDYWRRI